MSTSFLCIVMAAIYNARNTTETEAKLYCNGWNIAALTFLLIELVSPHWQAIREWLT